MVQVTEPKRNAKAEWMRNYRLDHPDRVKASKLKEYQTNRRRYLARAQQQRDTGYRYDITGYCKTRWGADPRYRSAQIHQNRLYKLVALLAGHKHGSGKTIVKDVVGCASLDQFKQHLESLFLPGMTWSNYGRKSGITPFWEIDHIVPRRNFDTTCHEQAAAMNHYTNLRPLWREKNKYQKYGI